MSDFEENENMSDEEDYVYDDYVDEYAYDGNGDYSDEEQQMDVGDASYCNSRIESHPKSEKNRESLAGYNYPTIKQ